MSCFWLVTIGEPVPGDVHGARLMRTGLFARTLAARGHDVVWVTNRFDHFAKVHRADPLETELGGVRLRLLESRGYASNVSVARAWDHWQLVRDFRRVISELPSPDAIVSALPTPGLCAVAADFAESRGIPLVVDVRDRWPDVFLDLMPSALRSLAKLALWPMRRAAVFSLERAAAIWGHSQSFVDWGLSRTGRPRATVDRAFPHGYAHITLSDEERARGLEYWERRGLGLSGDVKIAAYVGTISRQCDFSHVLASVDELADLGIQWVLCGAGDTLEMLKREAKRRPGLHVPGWCGRAEVGVLLERATVGLMPYRLRENFRETIPNKAIEYLAYGVPIVWSLEGTELSRLIAEHGVGTTYNSDPALLAQAVATLCQSNERASQSQRAVYLYEQQFAAQAVYARMADALEAILREPSAACLRHP